MPDRPNSYVGLLPTDPQRIARYRVLGRLGAGGQGVVYLAEAPDGRRVAIKQLLRGLPELQDSRARRQLGKEVAAAQRVAPFCTAQVLDADVTGPSPYIVSEYIEGPTLQQHVRENGPLNGSALQWMAIGTATALAAIHQAGVVHRDLKPANVMMAADGPRVIDFGIARDLSTEVTVTSRVMGTPAYMAPEQVRNEPVGPATDLFAWASVVAFAATGKAPFEAGHMLAVAQRITSDEPDLTGVPAQLVPVLRRCLAKDPLERPTAQEVLGQLLGRPDASPAQAAGLVHRAVDPGSAPPRTLTAPPRTLTAPPVDQPRGHVPPTPLPPTPLPPTPLPPTPLPPTHPPEKSFVGRTLAIAALVLLIGLAVWGWGQADNVRAWAQDDTPGSTPSAAASTASNEPSAVPTTAGATTAAPTTPATSGSGVPSSPIVPEALDGDWEGNVFQPGGQTQRFAVRLELNAGEPQGRVEIDDLDCRGTVTVTAASPVDATLDMVIDENDSGLCAPAGVVKLTALGVDRASFYWRDAASDDNVSRGILARD